MEFHGESPGNEESEPRSESKGKISITEIQIFLQEGGGDARLRAFASITLSGVFVVRSLKVIEGEDRTFIAFPSRKTREGKYQDVVHPINREARAWIEEKVLDAYYRRLKDASGEA